MDLKSVCKISYGDKPYGWPGDIPIVRLNSDKLKKIGWTNKYSSEQAIKLSVKEMVSRFSFK